LLIACDSHQGTEASVSGVTTEPITGCSERRSVARVHDFAEALRTADLDALKVYWGSRFKWFSVTIVRRDGAKNNFAAFSPEKALRYAREKDGLPLRLKAVQTGDRYQGSRGVGYQGRWGSGNVVGKGDLLCSSPQIRVWSMAVHARR
jgi:hypothetical protein